MQRSELLQKHRIKSLIKTLEAVKSKSESELNFINVYGEMYRLPKRFMRINSRQHKKVLDAANTLMEHFKTNQ